MKQKSAGNEHLCTDERDERAYGINIISLNAVARCTLSFDLSLMRSSLFTPAVSSLARQIFVAINVKLFIHYSYCQSYASKPGINRYRLPSVHPAVIVLSSAQGGA